MLFELTHKQSIGVSWYKPFFLMTSLFKTKQCRVTKVEEENSCKTQPPLVFIEVHYQPSHLALLWSLRRVSRSFHINVFRKSRNFMTLTSDCLSWSWYFDVLHLHWQTCIVMFCSYVFFRGKLICKVVSDERRKRQ